jgi:hypothetical protein
MLWIPSLPGPVNLFEEEARAPNQSSLHPSPWVSILTPASLYMNAPGSKSTSWPVASLGKAILPLPEASVTTTEGLRACACPSP